MLALINLQSSHKHKSSNEEKAMKSSPSLSLLAAALVAAPASISAITWTDIDSACDIDSYAVTDPSVTCNGADTCAMGDTAVISGEVEAKNEFDGDATVTIHVCFLGMCPPQGVVEAGTLCGDWLTAKADGAECGAAGDYVGLYEVEIPVYDSVPSWLQIQIMNRATAYLTVGEGETCESEGEYEGYQMAYSMGILPLALLGAYALQARRRGREGEEDEEGEPKFVEMTDSVVV
ncbi:hypothetical protein ACHAWF_010543 [Thalassiosira exigua]